MSESNDAAGAGKTPAGKAPEPAKPSAASKIGKLFSKDRSPESLVKTRRGFVAFAVVGFLTTNFLMFLRFFFPRTIFEPKTRFSVGPPSDFGLGVDTRFQKSRRIWVVRTTDRIFVIFASCTHLGCTPDWKEAEQKFKCPCHGSGYDPEGVNYEGPAPMVPAGGVPGIAPGQVVNIEVTLESGDYVALCFVPDAGDGRLHIEHGMVLPFTVS